RGDAARALDIRDGVERQRRLTRGLRTIDLDDPTTGQPTDAERDVERDGAGLDHLHRSPLVAAEAHDRSLSELAVDLRQGVLEGLRLLHCGLVCGCGHGGAPVRSGSAAHRLPGCRRYCSTSSRQGGW